MAAIETKDGAALISKGLEKLSTALHSGVSDELVRYLEVMSRFHHYSFRNLMLILMQCEHATRVAGFNKWKQLGRHVKKGETAIYILAPIRIGRSKMKAKDGEEEEQGTLVAFKMVPVFDISSTEGDELPEFAKAQGEPGDNLARMETRITGSGIRLLEAEIIDGANGSFDADLGELTYRPGLTTAERFRVLVHEWAHKVLKHCERRFEMSSTVQETEAEAIAFVVCHALGIDSTNRSSDYIRMHRGSAELLGDSLDTIQKTAAAILKELEAAKPLEGTVPTAATVAKVTEANVACETNVATVSTDAEPPMCNHTLSVDEPGSTWAAEQCDDGSTRYSCNCCWKFFGRSPKAATVAATESVSDEQEQEDEEQPLRIGRADYDERRDARIDKYETRANNARAQSTAAYNSSSSMAEAIPFGQPILVGHHSEARDRRYRERIQSKMGKSVELGDKAAHYESKAAAAESNRAISSDDPEAVTKLREKLVKLEGYQAYMKRLNAAWRKAKKPKSANIQGWATVAKLMEVEPERLDGLRKALAGTEHMSGGDGAPCPPYELQNKGAEIRRVKKRIAELLEEGRVVESSEVDHGVCTVVQNVEINRVQLVFSGIPPVAVRDIVKQHGFHWARSERAWQRQLNKAGRNAAKYVVEQLQKMEGATNEHSSNTV